MGRGLSFFDWYGQLRDTAGNKRSPNVRLVQELHLQRIRELFESTFKP
jgi:hypothetical protein